MPSLPDKNPSDTIQRRGQEGPKEDCHGDKFPSKRNVYSLRDILSTLVFFIRLHIKTTTGVTVVIKRTVPLDG